MEQQTETFRDVKGYEGRYEISDLGNLRSILTYSTRIVNGTVKKHNHTNYVEVTLSHRSKNRTGTKDKLRYVMTHRLVAEAFLPNPENKPMVNHKDRNGENNNLSNLEWVTASENMKHSSDLIKKEGPITNAKAAKSNIEVARNGHEDLIGKLFSGRELLAVFHAKAKTGELKWYGVFECSNCLTKVIDVLSNAKSRLKDNKTVYCNTCNGNQSLKIER